MEQFLGYQTLTLLDIFSTTISLILVATTCGGKAFLHEAVNEPIPTPHPLQQ